MVKGPSLARQACRVLASADAVARRVGPPRLGGPTPASRQFRMTDAGTPEARAMLVRHAALTLTLTLTLVLTPAAAADDFRDLFDGKALDGWVIDGPAKDKA